MSKQSDILSGILLEENHELTMEELCQVTSVKSEWLITLVEEGIVEPLGGVGSDDWRFGSSSLIRVRKVLRLQQDLGINIPGAALTLDLLDEIESLRQQLFSLGQSK